MPNPNLPINTKFNSYIGARYVPKFANKDLNYQWTNTRPYEPLMIVLYQGNSYTSTTFVPIGIDINNKTYWAETGNYNAQIEIWINKINELTEQVNNMLNPISTENYSVNSLPSLFNSYETGMNIRNENNKNSIIRLATFNYEYSRNWFDDGFISGAHYDSLAKTYMMTTGANIIGLQECSSYYATSNAYVDSLKTPMFSNGFFYPYLFASTAAPGTEPYVNGRQIGESIFSQWSITDVGAINVNPNAQSTNTEPRSAIYGNILIYGNQVKVYCFHNTFENQSIKEEVMNNFKQVLANDNSPYIIVLGDFNLYYSELPNFLPPNFTMCNTDKLTWPAPNVNRGIDNILIKGFTKIQDGTTPAGINDHLIYWCDIK